MDGSEMCAACRFWQRGDAGELYPAESGVGLHISEDGEGLDVGECHRYPPVISDEQARRAIAVGIYSGKNYPRLPLGVLSSASVYPHTDMCDCCGEFQPKAPS